MKQSAAHQVYGHSIKAKSPIHQFSKYAARTQETMAQTDVIATSSSENTKLSTHNLTPGTITLKKKVATLMEQGNIHKAFELLENAIEHATEYEMEYILDLAHSALEALEKRFPNEQSLINNLTQIIENHSGTLISGVDFSGNNGPVFG